MNKNNYVIHYIETLYSFINLRFIIQKLAAMLRVRNEIKLNIQNTKI